MKEEKKTKVGISLYIVLFFIIYGLMQLGFTGLYTYTTFGALVTCIMYFSIYLLFTIIYVFFKFRKNEENQKNKTIILNKIFIATIVVILLATVMQIYSYFYNMNGMNILKEEYDLYTKYIDKNSAENVVENIVEPEGDMKVFQEMIEYNEYASKIDGIYTEMKEHVTMFIFIRLLVDLIDIIISVIVVFIISDKFIEIVCKRKDKRESIEEKREDGESK